MTMTEKEKLLLEIQALTNKKRSYSERSPLANYNITKSKIVKKHGLPEVDQNGYYLVIPATYNMASPYSQKYQGRTIVHTERRVKISREIDLEKARFRSWQEMALSDTYRDIQVPQSPEYTQIMSILFGISPRESADLPKPTWIELFEIFYHIDRRELSLWSYEEWREHYKRCPSTLLDIDFTFKRHTKPGTKEFMPEWLYHTQRVQSLEDEHTEQEQMRRRSQYVANMSKGRRKK